MTVVDPLVAAIEQANQKQAAERMLGQVLNQALNQPARVTRVTGPTVVTVAKEADGNPLLLVGMVNGDRWDIPLDVNTARRIAFALASSGTPDNEQAPADEVTAT